VICFAISIWTVCTFSQSAYTLEDLFCAIDDVETPRGMEIPFPSAYIGPYQIGYACWNDSSVPGKWTDVLQHAYAERVMIQNWKNHVPEALDTLDFETLSRMHYGGPRGRHWPSTEKYWHMVKARLEPCRKERISNDYIK
jgi:hypothetical protein